MKKILISGLLFCLITKNAFSVFETGMTDADIQGMAKAVSAAKIENAFMLNPGNINRDNAAYFSFSGHLGSRNITDLVEGGGSIYSKIILNKIMAVAAGIDYTFFNYSGGYPGASGLLWNEIQTGAVFNINLRDVFAIGILGKYYNYSTDAEVYGEKYGAEHGGDLGAGFKANIKIFSMGASFNNILSLNKQTSRIINAGIALDIRSRINPAVDFSIDIDKLCYDINPGLQIFMLRNMIILRTGLLGGDLFNNPALSFGATLRFHRYHFSYGGSYNFKLESIGNHYMSLGLLFNKIDRGKK
ncbi:MAG TPA: hypothetical protein DC049_15630 [Spirochaetia bacterium]|nr:hypothetical protein [Spirochaetia bacterium]